MTKKHLYGETVPKRSVPRRARRSWLGLLITGLVATLVALGAPLGAHGAERGTRLSALGAGAICGNPREPATRDPANPLMLSPAPTGGDVLRGARLFVAGPAHGTAAGAIAELLGIDTGQPIAVGQPLAGLSTRLTWTRFETRVVKPRLASRPAVVAQDIRLLTKIADEPTPLRVSVYSDGGSPAGIYTATRNLFCRVLVSDPGSIPIVTTYFAHPELGACSTSAAIDADAPRLEAQTDAMARAIGRRPVALFLELDAVGSSSCMARSGSLPAWETLIRHEAMTFEALPHTAVYLEGGYSDATTPAYAASVLKGMGLDKVQGFFTNDTHLQWTSHELRYAEAVSARTGGAHFIINTAANGRGPLLNPHPRTEGVEDLCNPPNRGLGIPDTTDPGLNRGLDGLLWLVPPGNSSGPCEGGTANGTFWIARAIALAADANAQLGPGYPSRPY